MDANIAQCRHLLALSEQIFAGLDDSHRALESHVGTKTAGWLIGHLAVTGDFARRLCGRKPLCPLEWRPLFSPETQVSSNAADYPPMSALKDAFRAVYSDLCDAAPGADPLALAKENPYAPARPSLPTAGELVAYLMSGHLGYHLGQLVAWRAAAGFGRLKSSESPMVSP